MKSIRAVYRRDGRVELRFGYDPELVDFVKDVSGFSFDKATKCWVGGTHSLVALQYAAWKLGGAIQIPVSYPLVQAPPALVVGALPLRDYQAWAAGQMLSRPEFVLVWSPRVGKAQPLTAKVMTPNGWRQMGALRVGDLITHPSLGTTTVTGVFPQGQKPIYRVTTVDGASTECCAEHLWSVKTHKTKNTTGNMVTYPLASLIERGPIASAGRCRWYLPLCAPVEFAGPEWPSRFHPYVLGVLLGNGHFGKRIGLTTADHEISNRVEKLLGSRVKLRCSKAGGRTNEFNLRGIERGENQALTWIAELGLSGKLSYEKFIPAEYKMLGIEARLELLRGLLDTDGDTPTRSTTVYNTTSSQLRDDVVELVQSLGGFASFGVKEAPKYTYKDEIRIGRPCWRVYIRLPQNPFFLSRKARCWKLGPLTRGITSVAYVGEKEAQCISVAAADGLYVTDGYIVTHNTFSGIIAAASGIAARQFDRAIVVAPAGVVGEWQGQLKKIFPGMRQRELVRGLGAEDVARAHLVVVQHDQVAHCGAELRRLTTFGKFALLFDEPQRFQDWKAPRSKVMLDLGTTPNCVHRWGFTGTPMPSNPEDLALFFGVFGGIGGGKWGFLKRYASAAEGQFGWACGDPSNLDELAVRLQAVSHRLTREEVASHLPPIDRSIRLVEMTRAEGKRYKAMEAALGKQAAKGMKGQGQLDALRLLAGTTLRTKLKEVMERIRFHCVGRGKKILVGANFHDSLKALATQLYGGVAQEELPLPGASELPAPEIPFYMAGGWMTPERRTREIAAWKADPRAVPLLVNVLSSGVGIDLSDADGSIVLEVPWVPGDAIQFEARVLDVHLGKRTAPPWVEYVLARGTVDEDMALANLKKISNIDKVVGAERESTGLANALRQSGVVDTMDLGLQNHQQDTVDAAMEGLRRRMLGLEAPSDDALSVSDPSAISGAALAGAMEAAFELEEEGGGDAGDSADGDDDA